MTDSWPNRPPHRRQVSASPWPPPSCSTPTGSGPSGSTRSPRSPGRRRRRSTTGSAPRTRWSRCGWCAGPGPGRRSSPRSSSGPPGPAAGCSPSSTRSHGGLAGSERGCAFVNVYAEVGGTDHPAVPIIRAEKSWMRDRFTAADPEAGVAARRARRAHRPPALRGRAGHLHRGKRPARHRRRPDRRRGTVRPAAASGPGGEHAELVAGRVGVLPPRPLAPPHLELSRPPRWVISAATSSGSSAGSSRMSRCNRFLAAALGGSFGAQFEKGAAL